LKLTLLEMVQHILAAMGSDEVNSYDDTVESHQVAQLIRQVFYDAAVELSLPEHEGMFELNASGNADLPCLMTLPSSAIKANKVYYDNKAPTDTYSKMVLCTYLPFDDFQRMQSSLRDMTGDVGEMQVTTNTEIYPVLYASNRHPSYYTTTDDNTLLFDSYDRSIDTTLQKNKSMVHGLIYPTFVMANDTYPQVDPSQFPYLLAKAKTRAFNELKQTLNQESATEARRQKIVLQKRKHTVKKEDPIYGLPRYGRR